MDKNSTKDLARELVMHQEIKRKHPNYPALPKSIKDVEDMYGHLRAMTDEQVKHLKSTLAGFKGRVHNYNSEKEKMMMPPTREQLDRQAKIEEITSQDIWE